MSRSRGRRRPSSQPIPLSEAGDLRRQLTVALNNLELAEQRISDTPLRESTTELEQRLNDEGWRLLTTRAVEEFSDEGRRRMREVCRIASVVSPLLVRALSLRSAYVHGQGCEITARANGREDDEQDVQAVVGTFLGDDGNQRAYTGAEARDRLEHTLGTDGGFWVALFTRPMTGEVQTRVFLADEISEIIRNPEDRTEPWLYRRSWIEVDYTTGAPQQVQRERLYPALGYRPMKRARKLGAVEIAWDTPLLHVSVNRPESWEHGVPDVYPALNWSRAYKEFLEQWAILMRSLARFAWRLTAKGNAARTQAKAKMGARPVDPDTGQQTAIGASAITPADQVLEAIPKSGAVIDSESGRPLAMMVAAALGIPVTMLLSDPGQTGARATAETLDQPTELVMQQRRSIWEAADRQILRYVIAESVRAPQGALKGRVTRDRWRDRETVVLDGDTDDTIDFAWPDLDDVPTKERVDAVVAANDTRTIPPEVTLRMLLAALGNKDPESIVEKLLDADGNFIWPSVPGLGVGQAAVDAVRNGDDPAKTLPGGRMAPDNQDEPDDEPDGD